MANWWIKLYIVLVCVICVHPEEIDYYWRDYNGQIPEDALPGGKDINGRDTYIGQVYIHGFGLYIAQLVPGSVQLNVACHGVKKVDDVIKILCSRHKENFAWLKTTWTSLHVDTINKHAVVGGYTHIGARGKLNIGRIMYQGILKIGPVASSNLNNAYLYFENKNKLERVKEFEVLIYIDNKSEFSIDARMKPIEEGNHLTDSTSVLKN